MSANSLSGEATRNSEHVTSARNSADFYWASLQRSLETLRVKIGFDYAGIWLPGNDGPTPMYESGTTSFLKDRVCADQIRASELNQNAPLLCPTDSADGGVDVVFRFKDALGRSFAYVLLDDIAKARYVSEWEVQEILEEYYRKIHVMLLESRIFALESKLDGVRARLNEAEERSNVDGLTGLLVRRRIEEILSHEIGSLVSGKSKGPLSVVLADVDHFKKVNDTHGHQSGDAVLRGIADVLNVGYHANGYAHTKRPTDSFGRFGGEEFIFVLPNTPLERAASFANKVRMIIENLKFESKDGSRFSVTTSFGVSEITSEKAGWFGVPELSHASVKEADERLYKAKHAGRNQVISE